MTWREVARWHAVFAGVLVAVFTALALTVDPFWWGGTILLGVSGSIGLTLSRR